VTIFSERQGLVYVTSDSQGLNMMVSNFECFQSAGVYAKDQRDLFSAETVAGWFPGRRSYGD
jgi:hypothetical protein